MARDYYIFGESIVKVKFGYHVPPRASGGFVGSVTADSNLSELGLAVGPITVSPQWNHTPITPDDYGPGVPAELLADGCSEVRVGMTLVHYDEVVLEHCISESMGFTPSLDYNDLGLLAGVQAAAGQPHGGFHDYYASGWRYLGVNVVPGSPGVFIKGWRFRACVLAAPPQRIPLGTRRSLVELEFRAIPYRPPAVAVTVQTEVVTTLIRLFQLLDAGQITQAQFDIYEAQIVTFGTATVVLSASTSLDTEIRSSGAVVWDRNVDQT